MGITFQCRFEEVSVMGNIFFVGNMVIGETVGLRGVDMGGDVTMWKKQKHAQRIVLKVAGGNYWSAIGQTSYSPAFFMVCSIEKNERRFPEIENYIVINSFLEIPIRKPEK